MLITFNWPARIAYSKAVAGGWIVELAPPKQDIEL